jgi:hypothetical protein
VFAGLLAEREALGIVIHLAQPQLLGSPAGRVSTTGVLTRPAECAEHGARLCFGMLPAATQLHSLTLRLWRRVIY